MTDLYSHLVHRPPDLVTKLTTNIVQSTPTPVLNDIQERALLSIREKIRIQHLVLTEADKGSTMIVLDRAEYHHRMVECLESLKVDLDSDFNFDEYNGKI